MDQKVLPSTQEGWARVVPATCPGKQEHLTVCDRSSMRFLLQHLCTATTSQVPCLIWWWPGKWRGRERPSAVREKSDYQVRELKTTFSKFMYYAWESLSFVCFDVIAHSYQGGKNSGRRKKLLWTYGRPKFGPQDLQFLVSQAQLLFTRQKRFCTCN